MKIVAGNSNRPLAEESFDTIRERVAAAIDAVNGD
jgi:hypothetical protein